MDKKLTDDYTKLLYKIIKSLPAYVAYKNKDQVYEVVSDKVDELYAKKFDSIEGKTITEVYSDGAQEDVLAQDKEVFDLKKTVDRTIEVETPKGVRTLQLTRIPIFNDQSEIEGVLSFSKDINDFIQVQEKLDSLSNMQNKLIGIIQLFSKLTIHNYADIINQALETLGKAIGADRAYIFSYHFEKNTMDNIYEWCEEGIQPEIDELKNIPITDFLDGWVNNHRAREVVIIPDVDDLDKESNLYKMLKPQGTQSLMTLPLFIDDVCYGFIGFDAVDKKREWRDIPEIFKIVPELYAALFHQFDMITAYEKMSKEKADAESSQSNFLAKVTHEIKTPISGITASLDLLKETELNDDQNQYTEIMTYSIDILKSMVENILQHSKIEANKLIHKSTDFNLEQEIIKLIQANKYMASSKNIGLYLNYDYQIPLTLSTDKGKLIQILNNLISNAVKYTNYGSVEVNVSTLRKHSPYIDVLFEVEDTGIGIDSKDQAQITKEFYQVGDKLNKNPSGTGLGLSIASELVRFLKGKLKVSSQKNVGSKFYFTLTLYAPVEENKQVIQAKALVIDITKGNKSSIDGLFNTLFSQVNICKPNECVNLYDGVYDMVFVHSNNSKYFSEMIDDVSPILNHFSETTKTVLLIDGLKDEIYLDASPMFNFIREFPIFSETLIECMDASSETTTKTEKKETLVYDNQKLSLLIVDDNNINRIVMKKTIQAFNINVTEAENGYEAIKIAKEINFDMILMDILMPGLNGYETCENIRKLGGLNSSIPIVAVSANEVESTKEKALSYGMSGVLEKPLNKNDLKNLLTDYFGEDFSEGSKQKHPKSKLFDINAFEEFFPEEDLRKEIIDTFLDELPSDLERLDKAFQSKSTSKIYKAIHYLKGSFAYLKSQRLFDLSVKLLDLCDNKRLDDLLDQKDNFINEYRNLHELLKDYLNTLK